MNYNGNNHILSIWASSHLNIEIDSGDILYFSITLQYYMRQVLTSLVDMFHADPLEQMAMERDYPLNNPSYDTTFEGHEKWWSRTYSLTQRRLKDRVAPATRQVCIQQMATRLP